MKSSSSSIHFSNLLNKIVHHCKILPTCEKEKNSFRSVLTNKYIILKIILLLPLGYITKLVILFDIYEILDLHGAENVYRGALL
jgi:hypothetical protein